MHPILFQFGSITLYTYGLFVGLGFLAAVAFAGNRAEKNGIIQENMTDLFFIILVSSILGARVLYVVINFNEFSSDPIAVFKIWNGGLVFYGGFIAAAIAAFMFVKKKRLPLGKTADIIAPSIALGHAIGRLGCFAAGCCYGRHCDLPWAVTFDDPASLAPLHISLHPTQLYESASNFIIFFLLLFLDRNKKTDGIIFWSYIFIYGLTRSFIETFRGDPRGDFIATSISVSQGIGLLMAIVGLCMIIYLSTNNKKADTIKSNDIAVGSKNIAVRAKTDKPIGNRKTAKSYGKNG